MSKLDEKQVEQAHKSAAVQKDKAFEEWVSQSVLDETADMVNGLENDPDLDDFEPSEELLQEIVGIANERGLLAEEEIAEEVEVEEIKFPVANEQQKIEEIKPVNIMRNTTKGKVKCYSRYKHNAVKWVAMIAVTLLGIFGVSMSSQANRAYIMQKADELFGNDVNTKLNNSDDILVSDTREEIDREEVEEELGVSLPVFYYLPDGMEYYRCKINQESKTAHLQYKYKDGFVYMQVLANANDASGIYRNDKGVLEKNITSDWTNINVELWKIEEEGDDIPTYLVQWDYKNSYYSIFGKISEDEITNIVKDIIY